MLSLSTAATLLLFSSLGQSLNFLSNNPLLEGLPWGKHTTDPSCPPPNTGVTRHYSFTIARSPVSPDGYLKKSGIVINGQFPGPKIEANYGDWIEVLVKNNITGPEEGTSLHWHGLLQKETPWYDGVPGISQCPIAPGSSFTYRFRADVYGSTWYHAHYSGQYADGAFGPLVIYGPSHVKYDIDVGPVLLTDWYHQGYFDLIKAISGTNEAVWHQAYQNTFINGRNPYNCSLVTDGTPCTDNAPRAQFQFKTGKTHLLRLVNAAANGLMKFTIDEHQMTVVSSDFTPIVPYNTSVITLAVGQRADILVHGTGSPDGAYWMRNNQSTIPCAQADNTSVTSAKAIIRYERTPLTKLPTSISTAPYLGGDVGNPLATCKTDPINMTVPFYPAKPKSDPDMTITILANQIINSTGNEIYVLNNREFRADYNNPVLFQANAGNTNFAPQANAYNLKNATSVRIIINSNTTGPHPMHLHGHNFYVLDEGPGMYDGHTIVNPQNPLRRDTQEMRSLGYAVIQFETDNPGVWPYHCHIATHLSTGFSVTLVERPDDIKKQPIPMIVPQTCKDWKAYTDSHTVDEIDSGI